MNLNDLRDEVFQGNVTAGWWSIEDLSDATTKESGKYTKQGAMLIGSKLALIHSEVSEALEGMRKGLQDDISHIAQ